MRNWLERGVLLGVLPLACYPSASFVGSSVESLDCRSGAFVAELKVERQSARKVAVTYELLPGDFNVDKTARSPEREVLRGKEGRNSRVRVEGKLIDKCAAGGVNILASYAPSGSTGFVEVEPVLPVRPAGSPEVSSGVFAYTLAFTCCGPEAAGVFEVTAQESEGMTGVEVDPPRFTCAQTEEHEVMIRGRLLVQTAQLRLSVEETSTGSTCSYRDAVARGPASVP